MLVPELWLSDYIDIDVNIDEFCEKMIMSGSNIETAEPVAKGISGVVIGKVFEHRKASRCGQACSNPILVRWR